MGRVVVTHSTYIEGLIPLLKKLSRREGIKTVTPGIIKRVNGFSEKLNIKITRPIKGGFKLIARKGRSMQEIFIITSYAEEVLKSIVVNLTKN